MPRFVALLRGVNVGKAIFEIAVIQKENTLASMAT